MATSNVQLQQIQQQLTALGVANPQQYSMLQTQVASLKARISTMDQTNLAEYSAALERLYSLQTRLNASNTGQIQELLNQKIQILSNLTSN